MPLNENYRFGKIFIVKHIIYRNNLLLLLDKIYPDSQMLKGIVLYFVYHSRSFIEDCILF
jgi:hypothetical protein